jgi:hypothetical protein
VRTSTSLFSAGSELKRLDEAEQKAPMVCRIDRAAPLPALLPSEGGGHPCRRQRFAAFEATIPFDMQGCSG